MINLFDLYKSVKDFKKYGYASKRVEKKRIKECSKCDQLTKIYTCKQCGCYMKAKVKFKVVECPLGKW